MTQGKNQKIITGIVAALILITAILAGCTGAVSQPAAPAAAGTAAGVSTTASAPAETAAPTLMGTAAPETPAAVAATITPAPGYTYAEGNVVAFTAASLKGASPALAAGFEKMYPGHHVVFNLDGTQAIKTQVRNGAYADVFISAGNTHTNELKKDGYFTDGTVRTFATNYVIVIMPASNPAKIQDLSDLAKPGVKIARAAKTVPVGTATNSAIANLAKSTYGNDWSTAVDANTITYETSEPGVTSKVALGEVDAGFVYESTATAAKSGTFMSISIPKKDNYLQTYTIGILKGSQSKGAASDFETFMLSELGQQILKDYGFKEI